MSLIFNGSAQLYAIILFAHAAIGTGQLLCTNHSAKCLVMFLVDLQQSPYSACVCVGYDCYKLLTIVCVSVMFIAVI